MFFINCLIFVMSADDIGIHSTLPQNPFETRDITITILENIIEVKKTGIFKTSMMINSVLIVD